MDLFAEDMDGDGDMDLVSTSYGGDTIAWHENDGNTDPTWTTIDVSVGFSDGPYELFAADMDGDGDMDILSAFSTAKTFAWFENDGNADPTWAAENISTSTNYAIGISAADMNGDGAIDVVSHNTATFIGMRMVEFLVVEKTNVTDSSCSISPELPLGLTMAQGTCTISGTPLEEVPITEFLVRAKKDGFVYSTTINISSYSPDPDGDGYCDINITVEGTCIAVDAFPGDSTEWLDTDGDGIGNNGSRRMETVYQIFRNKIQFQLQIH